LNLIRVMPAKGQDNSVQTSVFLAKLLGPVFLLIGAGIVANRDAYRLVADEVLRSRALIYISGVMSFLSGLAIVLVHNVWAADWRVIITIIGWLAIVRGVVRVLRPEQSVAFMSRLLAREGVLIGSVAVMLVLGALLTFFGYVR
jgi:uncharacterized membrane protein